MRGASVRRERFLPYAYERAALTLEVTSCRRDDEPVPLGADRIIELHGRWHRAEIDVQARMPAAAVARLVPSAEREAAPLALLLALRSEATRLRRGVVIPFVGGAASGTLGLRHDELGGAPAEIHGFLVRTKPLARRTAGFAHAAGARVAHAPPWTLAVEPTRPPAARGLDVRFKSFTADASIPTREKANLYQLDCAQDAPVLWLNADVAQIAEVLRSEGTRGQRARLRDVMFDRIVTAVRIQLVMRAAVDAHDDGPVYAWQKDVLEDALARLYPHLQPEERRERLRRDMLDPAELVRRIDDDAQAREKTSDALRKLLEES